MCPSVDVRSLQALEQLRAAFDAFRGQAEAAVRAANASIQREQAWLDERLGYWRRERAAREQALRQAEAALAACRACGARDPRTGAYTVPSCLIEQAAVAQARRRVQEAQSEAQKVEHWRGALADAAAGFFTQSERFGRTVLGAMPGAHAFLEHKIAELSAYLAASGVSAGVAQAAAPAPGGGAPAIPAALAATGMQMIELDDIDPSEYADITGAADFHKASAQEMADGFHKLNDVVAPAVANGAGADYFDRLDASQGLDYPNGYRSIYDAFYGHNCIILDRVGGSYHVTNGRHRLFVARQLGLTHVPARVAGVRP